MQEDSLHSSLHFVNPRTAQNSEACSFKTRGWLGLVPKLSCPLHSLTWEPGRCSNCVQDGLQWPSIVSCPVAWKMTRPGADRVHSGACPSESPAPSPEPLQWFPLVLGVPSSPPVWLVPAASRSPVRTVAASASVRPLSPPPSGEPHTRSFHPPRLLNVSRGDTSVLPCPAGTAVPMQPPGPALLLGSSPVLTSGPARALHV